MITDITYCDWLCPNERCERNAYRLEEAVKQNSGLLKQVSFAAFTDCPNYGSIAGCFVPMKGADDDSKRD